MKLYFAYGSNMDQVQMLGRCPNAKLLGSAQLKDYKLAFTIYSPKRKCGCADVVKTVGQSVYGLLYELTNTDLERMDTFEGHPIHYRRIEIPVTFEGRGIIAQTYEVNTKSDNLAPSKEYLELLQRAAKEFSFPEEYTETIDSFEM